MATYDALRDLPLEIESYTLEGLQQDVSSEFVRRTTVIRLQGEGEEGVGEDVTYDGDDQIGLQEEGPTLPLQGSFTIDSFSELVGRLNLFPTGPDREDYRNYRRWAFESAALDLALRQANRPLTEALGRSAQPVNFVVSMRLGEPPTSAPVRGILENYPDMRFKLDATSEWSDDLIAELRELGVVDSIDLKGQYKGTVVDQPPDVDLYRRIVEAFPDAWIEDPNLTPETETVLAGAHDRITWDAIIHSVADIEDLPVPPEDGERQAVPVREPRGALRRLRLLRRALDRSVRRRAVRARSGTRPDPVPRVGVPPRYAERRRPWWIQRGEPGPRPALEPAGARPRADRVPQSQRGVR